MPKAPAPRGNRGTGAFRYVLAYFNFYFFCFCYFFLPWFFTASIAAAAASGSR